MEDVRWKSPFPYTLAFNLFKKHFTELNEAYWAFVPANNTIKSLAKKQLHKDSDDPKSFFLIPDEEDRRIAPTFGEWKRSTNIFAQYTRLNMVMLLSSCFETYLRTAVALAFESDPGVLILAHHSVDGINLLKGHLDYGNINSKDYLFQKEVDSICHGDWQVRFSNFQHFFGKLPKTITDQKDELNAMVTSWTKQHTAKEIIEILRAHSVPCAPIHDVSDVVNDEHIAKARQMICEIDHPVEGKMRVTGNPVKMTEADPYTYAKAPTLGKDTGNVLADILHLDEDTIAYFTKSITD